MVEKVVEVVMIMAAAASVMVEEVVEVAMIMAAVMLFCCCVERSGRANVILSDSA
mgnify:CR=1 FL=1